MSLRYPRHLPRFEYEPHPFQNSPNGILSARVFARATLFLLGGLPRCRCGRRSDTEAHCRGEHLSAEQRVTFLQARAILSATRSSRPSQSAGVSIRTPTQIAADPVATFRTLPESDRSRSIGQFPEHLVGSFWIWFLVSFPRRGFSLT